MPLLHAREGFRTQLARERARLSAPIKLATPLDEALPNF